MINLINLGLGGGSLLQVANRSCVQMMSYVIETPDGKTVVIDGGNDCYEDAEALRQIIFERGGKVSLWLLTHAHKDHYGALFYLLKNNDKLDFKIEKLMFNFPEVEWFKHVDNGYSYIDCCEFLKSLKHHGIECSKLEANTIIKCGGMTYEVINDCANYKDYSTVNDTSIVILARFPKRDVLFLGDIGVTGGQYLLEHFNKEKIKCDIVQMAHHGQQGVDKSFYEYVQPKVCLYTAPDWLWDNDSGEGKGSGPWHTLTTRQWMEEMGVELSCPCAYGDYLFR